MSKVEVLSAALNQKALTIDILKGKEQKRGHSEFLPALKSKMSRFSPRILLFMLAQ